MSTGTGTRIGSSTGSGTGIDTGNSTGIDTGNSTGIDAGNGTEIDAGNGTGIDTGNGAGIDTGNGAGTLARAGGVTRAGTRIRGVLAPVLTPFAPDLEPDAERFIAHCRWLTAHGAGLALFGTNSESASLSVGERLSLTDALLAAGLPADRMMPGTGLCALPDAVTLTRHAVQNGAAGVLMLPPFYFKGVSDEGLFAHFSEVVERVADDRLRIYLYNIPKVSGVPITLNLVEMLRRRYPGTVVGAKDSSGNWDNTRAMIDNFAADGFDVFPASESTLSRALPVGAAGCISATVNVNPGRIRAVYEGWNGPRGAALQAKADVIRQIFHALPMIPAMKRAVAESSGDRNWAVVRPPRVALDDAGARTLLESLRDARFEMPGYPG